MYRTVFAWALAGALLLTGCTPASQQSNSDFELRKVERERDSLQLALDTERAQHRALRDRLEKEEMKWSTSRAETAALKGQVRRLNERIGELEGIISAASEVPLERPEVPASPLPTEVDEDLWSLSQQFGDRVWYDRGRGAISFANDRLFDSGSADVREDARVSLNRLAGILASPELAEFEAIIVGHTDSTPITKPETQAQHPTNWHLSVHRSIAVKDALVDAGVPPTRMGVMGYAHFRPVSGDNAQNRRVEVFIVRRGGVQPFQPVRPTANR